MTSLTTVVSLTLLRARQEESAFLAKRDIRFRCRGGGVKGRGFAKNTRIRVHYYEVLTADQRSSSIQKIYMFKKTVAHTHLWTCACALVHINSRNSTAHAHTT